MSKVHTKHVGGLTTHGWDWLFPQLIDSRAGFSGSTYPTEDIARLELLNAGDCHVGHWHTFYSLICRLGCGFGCAKGSTSSIVFARWRQCALMWGHMSATWRIRLNHSSAAAMRLMSITLTTLVIFGHAHLDSRTDSRALRAEYCIMGIPHNTAIWLNYIQTSANDLQICAINHRHLLYKIADIYKRIVDICKRTEDIYNSL